MRSIARTALLTVLLVFALPAVALAAEPVEVAGTIADADGSAAAGVEVVLIMTGTDVILSTTTDATGAFVIAAEASVGDTLDLRATGATVTTGPDEEGCVRSSTPYGKASVVIETLPLAPVAIRMDQAVTSVVCQATASPKPPRARPTPPATDLAGDETEAPPAPGGALAVVIGTLALVAAVLLVTGSRRRA